MSDDKLTGAHCAIASFDRLKREIPDEAQSIYESALESVRDHVMAGGSISDEFVELRLEQAANDFRVKRYEQALQNKNIGDMLDINLRDRSGDGEFVDLVEGLDAAMDEVEYDPWFYETKRTNKSRRGSPALQQGIQRQNAMAGRVREVLEKIPKISKYGPFPLLSRQFNKDVLIALSGGTVDNPHATELAQVIRSLYDEQLTNLRKAGVYVQQIDNYFHRPWDNRKIRADEAGFKELMASALDESRHPAEVAGDQIMSNLLMRPVMGQTSSSIRRKVWFKSPELEVEAMLRFGSDNLIDEILSNLLSTERKLPLYERYGPNPVGTLEGYFKAIKDMANGKTAAGRRIAENPQKLKDYSKAKKRFEHMQRTLGADFDNPVLPSTAAAVARPIRIAATASALSQAVLALVGNDIPMYLGRAANLGNASFLRAAGGLLDTSDAEIRLKIAREWGFISDFGLGSQVDRTMPLAAPPGVTGTLGKADRAAHHLMHGTMFLQGMTSLTHRMQKEAGLMYLRGIADMAGTSFNDLAKKNPMLHSQLKEAGIDKRVWDRVAQKEFLEDVGGRKILSYSKIQDKHAAQQIAGFILREIDHTVTKPGQVLSSRLVAHTKAGSKSGEVMRGMVQFQAIAIAFTNNYLSMITRDQKYATSVAVGGALLGLGALRAQTKAMLRDEDPIPMDSPYLPVAALEQSGILYGVGTALSTSYRSLSLRGTSPDMSDLVGGFTGLGPSVLFGPLSYGMELGAGALTDNQKVIDRANGKAVRAGLMMVPGARLPYIAPFTSKMGNALRDSIDKTAPRRRKKTKKKLERGPF